MSDYDDIIQKIKEDHKEASRKLGLDNIIDKIDEIKIIPDYIAPYPQNIDPIRFPKAYFLGDRVSKSIYIHPSLLERGIIYESFNGKFRLYSVVSYGIINLLGIPKTENYFKSLTLPTYIGVGIIDFEFSYLLSALIPVYKEISALASAVSIPGVLFTLGYIEHTKQNKFMKEATAGALNVLFLSKIFGNEKTKEIIGKDIKSKIISYSLYKKDGEDKIKIYYKLPKKEYKYHNEEFAYTTGEIIGYLLLDSDENTQIECAKELSERSYQYLKCDLLRNGPFNAERFSYSQIVFMIMGGEAEVEFIKDPHQSFY